MSFLGVEFILFILVIFLLYYSIPFNFRWIVLLLASVGFYCTWGIEAVPFIVAAVVISWFAALQMEKVYAALDAELKENKELAADRKAAAKRKCRLILWGGIALILGMMIVTKALRLYGVSVVVPLGISYYTLSLIGYLADVYWRKEKAEKNILKLGLFAIYFPKILQGPISRHKTLAVQLVEGHRFDIGNFFYGIQLMVLGYFKKMVIADRLNLYVTQVYGNYDRYSGSVLLVGAIFGAFQLYCDFSGCMDMAVGMSKAMGIDLEKNFNHPFLSESAAEFWRRWHITLGAWFKDYVYMPIVVSPRLIKLSGAVRNKFGKRMGKAVMSAVPLAVVWLLTGLWHGTGLNYIVWGCFWGILIILSTVLEPELKKLNKLFHINADTAAWHLFRKLRTFILFVITRIITIPGDVRTTGEIFKKIFLEFKVWQLFDGTLFTLALNRPNFILAVLSICLVCLMDAYEERRGSVIASVASQPIVARWLVYFAVIFSIMIFGIYGPGYDASSFVYMQY